MLQVDLFGRRLSLKAPFGGGGERKLCGAKLSGATSNAIQINLQMPELVGEFVWAEMKTISRVK